MGKINEITQKVELSFENNKYTTEIKDDVVEFDSNGLSFNFLDPVNVPALLINGEEIVQSEPQKQADWNQTTSTEPDYIKNKPAIKAGQGVNSIIESKGTTASGDYSHAEGNGTTASGHRSHAEGQATTASGDHSHAEGDGTTAKHRSQHVFGEYNIADPSLNGTNDRGNYIEIVGNGAWANNSNARTLDWQGNEVLAGVLTCGGNIIASGTNINEALGSTQGFSGVKFRVISGSLQVCIDGVGAKWKTITLV